MTRTALLLVALAIGSLLAGRYPSEIDRSGYFFGNYPVRRISSGWRGALPHDAHDLFLTGRDTHDRRAECHRMGFVEAIFALRLRPVVHAHLGTNGSVPAVAQHQSRGTRARRQLDACRADE